MNMAKLRWTPERQGSLLRFQHLATLTTRSGRWMMVLAIYHCPKVRLLCPRCACLTIPFSQSDANSHFPEHNSMQHEVLYLCPQSLLQLGRQPITSWTFIGQKMHNCIPKLFKVYGLVTIVSLLLCYMTFSFILLNFATGFAWYRSL